MLISETKSLWCIKVFIVYFTNSHTENRSRRKRSIIVLNGDKRNIVFILGEICDLYSLWQRFKINAQNQNDINNSHSITFHTVLYFNL